MSKRIGRSGRVGPRVLGLLALALAAPAARADVAVEATLDRTSVAVNQRLTLTVTVEGTSSASEPELPDLPDFSVHPAGSSRVVSMVNFKTTTSTEHTYILVPKRAGTFKIPPIAVVHGDQRLTTRPLEVKVVDADEGPPPSRTRGSKPRRRGERDPDAVMLKAEASPHRVVVGEQVTLVVRFYQGVRLADEPSYQRPATTGFWVEEFPDAKSYYDHVEGRRYHVTELRYALFPTEAGEHTIGAARVDCMVRVDEGFRRDPFSLFSAFGRREPRVVTSDPITIEVQELPRAGRPASWNGAVGQFRIDAALDKSEAQAGDAVTLTVTVRGHGNMRLVADPAIPEVAGLRSYDARSSVEDRLGEERVGGVKTIKKAFIPSAAGDYEIPAIAYAYFDPGAHAYREIETAPLHLVVAEADGPRPAAGIGAGGRRQVLGQVGPELSFIRLGDPGLGRGRGPLHRSGLFWTLQILPLVALAAGFAYARHAERVRGDVGYARLRRSGRVAQRRLREARGRLKAGQREAFLGALSLALVGYVADRVNVSAAGMTIDDARAVLDRRGVDAALIDEFVRCVERCDHGRFAPGMEEQADREELLALAASILHRLGRAGV